MTYNKIDFINDLLASEKISIKEKNKILDLTKTELKNFDYENSENKKRIDSIEVKIKKLEGETINIPEGGIINEPANNLPEYINPKYLSNFLREFNKNSILKYVCHEVDDLDDFLKSLDSDSFELEKYLALIDLEYKKISRKYYGKINTKIQGLIWAYLKGEKTWSSDKIKIGWASKQLKLWCEENPTLVPNPGLNLRRRSRYDGFEFESFQTKNTNNRISSFSQLVIHFKHLFHVRSDNSLKNLIDIKNSVENYSEKIEFSIDIPENIEFYTDVDKTVQAYEKIIDMILEFTKNNNRAIPVINLSLKEENENIIFSIHHINSFYGKTITNCIERSGEKETNLIMNQINGVCQLKLKADFGNKNYAEINLWNGENRFETKLEKFEGVEFQLIF